MIDMGDLILGIGNEVVLTLLCATTIFLILIIASPGLLVVPYRRVVDFFNNLFLPGDDGQLDSQSTERVGPQRNSGDTRDPCAICLADPPRLGLETNCGHIFCGICLQTYWEMGNHLNGMNCPLCRQPVRMLFLSFTPEEAASVELEPDRRTIVSHSGMYNRRYSGLRRSWGSYLTDWPILMRHLWREFFSVGGLVFMFRMRIIMCFIAGITYLFSPLDIIPEAIFGIFGLLDDIFVLFLLAVYVTIIYRRVVINRGE